MNQFFDFRRGSLRGGALAVLVAAAFSITSAQAQSLDQALAMAYENNPQLLASRAGLRASDETLSELYAATRPKISLTPSLRSKHLATDPGQSLDSLPLSFRLAVNQELYDATAFSIERNAKHIIQSQRASLRATEQDVFLSVVESYMDTLLAQAVEELAESNIRRLTQQLDAVENRFRVGEASRTDISQARARLANARAELVRASGNVVVAAAAFESHVGVEPVDLEHPDVPLNLPATLGDALELAAEHPLVVEALETSNAAFEDVVTKRKAHEPKLGFSASYSRTWGGFGDIETEDNFEVSLRGSISIFDGGIAYAQIRQANETLSMRRAQVEQVRRQINANVTTTWQRLKSAQAQTVAYAEEIQANTEALEGTTRQEQVGERTVLDILDAEQALFQSRINLASAERDSVVASYALLAAIGKLNVRNISLQVVRYDVDESYHRAIRTWWGEGENRRMDFYRTMSFGLIDPDDE